MNFPGYLNVGEKLQEMEEALRRADRNIAYQRELIAELERYGSATVSARATLNAFEGLRNAISPAAICSSRSSPTKYKEESKVLARAPIGLRSAGF